MSLKKIKDFNKYYIHSDGYAFKIYGGKEVMLPLKIKNGVPRIKLGNNYTNIVWLLLEYFGDKFITIEEFTSSRFKFRVIDGRVPFSSISRVAYKSNKIDDYRLVKYKCQEKAKSANSRVNQISTITPYDVFNSLLRMKFKCTYCDSYLNPNTWELDHVHPISKGGLNAVTNISPSCKICNRMKSDTQINAFIHKVNKISSHYSDTFLFEIPNQKLEL